MNLRIVGLVGLCGVLVGVFASQVYSAQQEERGGYIIAQINIHDRDEYAKYGQGFAEIFRAHKGESVAFSEEPLALEGSWDFTRTVVVRFPTKQAALDWYNSKEYQEIVKHRWAASEANLVVIEGR